MSKLPSWFTVARDAILAFLLVFLGITVGVRYTVDGALFGRKISFFDTLISDRTGGSSTVLSKQLSSQVSMDTFWEVWNLLEKDYLEKEKLDQDKMVNGAISGMVSGIGDPYTMYLAPEKNKETGEDLAGTFYGVGIELGYLKNTLAIVAPLANGPGEKAGLQAGDLILHVKDESKNLDEDTTDWTLDEAVQKIRGEKGTPVVLTIYRDGQDATQEITINRDEIVVDTVTLDFKTANSGKQVAYLKISRFGDRTEEEWNAAVKKIQANKNVASIILDLRNNPGGYFTTSIDVASDFIKNAVVVSQQSQSNTQAFNSTGTARLLSYPTVVLVNKGSASAAEIVAGALRDDRQIKLIGEKTFGKGTVQDRVELSNGGGLHVTVGRWLTPSGSWIHEDGIAVDEEVSDNAETSEDEVLAQALREL